MVKKIVGLNTKPDEMRSIVFMVVACGGRKQVRSSQNWLGLSRS